MKIEKEKEVSSQSKKALSRKHDPEALPDPVLAKALRKRAKEETIPCAVAFEVAKECKVSPREIGKTADLLGISIKKCQLGLFGYGPQKSILKPETSASGELIQAIRESLQDERLPCAAAWEIAARFNVTKLMVGNVAEANGIKIRNCQLGAF